MWYWKGKKEVDFITMDLDFSLTAIQVCYSNKMPEREVQALQECKEHYKKG